MEEVENFCRGKRGKDWRRERDYLLRNASAGRLNYGLARQHQLPNGSGIIESTVRRVLNLRMKGASIFWTKENAEDMILLRAYYKSGRKHSPKGWIGRELIWRRLGGCSIAEHYECFACGTDFS